MAPSIARAQNSAWFLDNHPYFDTLLAEPRGAQTNVLFPAVAAPAFDVAQAALSEVERAQKSAKLLLDERRQPLAVSPYCRRAAGSRRPTRRASPA